MNGAARMLLEHRVLLLTPTGKDAELASSILDRAGLGCVVCSNMDELFEHLEDGAGALLIAEEAAFHDEGTALAAWMQRQPAWSDLPVLLIARTGADSDAVTRSMSILGNVLVLERPTRVPALVSSVRAALRARERQYQIRDHLADQERSIKTRSLLAAIVASSDDAIISKTLKGEILSWNAGAERLFGYTAEEAIGQSITMLIPADRQEEEPVLIQRLRNGERIEHFETIRITKDRRLIDVSLTVSPVRDSAGNIVAASKVARDITDRKRTEEALRDAARRKDEFLAVLAHELRNPLAPIRNSIHLLRLNHAQDPAVDRVSEMMERQVNHMVRLVDDLMEVSRITRGKIQLRTEPIEVAAIVRSAVETSRSGIDEAGHQLALSIPPEPLILHGDPVRLTQVLANLLNNSAKYTEKGGQIWLTVRREENEVALSVRDTGMGISAEMLPRIFEMFMQVDRSTDRAQGGLGIGLTLAKNLVELHGGRIEARSEGVGRGSEFVVHLPLKADLAMQDARPAARPVAGIPRRRILVVDDNRDAAESLGMVLKLLGVEARVVYSGPEALATLASYRPDVVLLDIGMPDMDGHEVARRIRLDPDFHHVTLIALTGWGQEEDRRRSRSAGFDHHLIKPTDVTALQTLLTSLQRPD